jgi:hypothetical protein
MLDYLMIFLKKLITKHNLHMRAYVEVHKIKVDCL